VKRIREHLTYANVMTTVLAFIVLAGGTAFAAGQLAKNSVGKKQLKANAVTTTKIKKGAVTKAKIKDGAVDAAKIKDGAVNGAKVADGSLGDADFNAAGTSFSRIVHEARGNAAVAMAKAAGVVPYPLSNGSYTQEAGRTDIFTGALDVTFAPGCAAPRGITAIAFLDPPDPTKLSSTSPIVAVGTVTDLTGASASHRINLGPYLGSSFQPSTPTNHNLVMGAQLTCTGGDGATMTFGAVDVIGAK
jgi:hypothetical protein